MWENIKKAFQKLDLFFFKIFIKIEKKIFPKRYLAAKRMITCIYWCKEVAEHNE